MNKYFFIENSYLQKIIVIAIVLMFLSTQLLFFYLLLICAYMALFHRKQIDLTTLQAIDKSLIVSPISGVVTNLDNTEDKKIIEIRVGLFSGFGLYMPFKGDILSHIELSSPHEFWGVFKVQRIKHKLKLRSSDSHTVSCQISGLSLIKRVNLFINGGDKAKLGALLGYLPYGGKVVIEVSPQAKILVKTGDIVQSTQTLLASEGNKV